MTSNNSVEARGATIDDAIEAGLGRLNARRTDVRIEVLDEGSRGVLGIGKRDAMVRLTLLDRMPGSAPVTAPPPVTPPPAAAAPTPPPAKPARAKPTPPRIERHAAPTRESRPAPEAGPAPEARPAPERPTASERPTPVERPTPAERPAPRPRRERPAQQARAQSSAATEEPISDEALALEAQTARHVVATLLEKLGIAAEVEAAVAAPDDRGQRVPVVNVESDAGEQLVGQRGRTLNALQFLTRAMVAQQLHTRAHFVIDVAGYRDERNEQLETLAREMAEKAVKFGRPIALKPMPPYERRIVHMTLREDKRVTTESKGEGDRRRVRIIPTQGGSAGVSSGGGRRGSGGRRRPPRDNR